MNSTYEGTILYIRGENTFSDDKIQNQFVISKFMTKHGQCMFSNTKICRMQQVSAEGKMCSIKRLH